jgi:hypothetical protein
MIQALYLLCATAGFIITVGSLLLIWKGRIVVDAEAKQITNVELPFGIKLQTNLPMVLMFLFGSGLLAFPIYQAMKREERDQAAKRLQPVKMCATVESSQPLSAVVLVDEKTIPKGKNTVYFEVPQRRDYTIVYLPRDNPAEIDRKIVALPSNGDCVDDKKFSFETAPPAAPGRSN